jgi:hypothetical protein
MIALSSRSLVWITAGLAAVSIAIAAAPLPRRFAGESGLPPPPVTSVPPPADAVASVDPILAWSPFGHMAQPADVTPAGETSLGLTLHGVVIAEVPERSAAIVSPPSGPSEAYAVGQEVASGTTLVEIHGDRVVLLVDGRRETLGFPEARREIDRGVSALQALVTDGATEAPAPDTTSE